MTIHFWYNHSFDGCNTAHDRKSCFASKSLYSFLWKVVCLFFLTLLIIDDDAVTSIFEKPTKVSLAHGFARGTCSKRHSKRRPKTNQNTFEQKRNKERSRDCDNNDVENSSIPNHLPTLPGPRTIKNPYTNRQIKVGGPTYKTLMKEGTWVEHNGTLCKLDLKMLAEYQQGRTMHQPDQKKVDVADDGDMHITTDKNDWYCIMPSVVIDDDEEIDVNFDTATKVRKRRSLTQKERYMLNEELLFVCKPSGMNCVPARHEAHNNSNSLATKVMSIFGPNAKLCHRLDRDTSGILIFGLTKSSHRNISKQFENRTTRKTYTALIAGHPTTTATSTSKSSGLINLPIGKQLTREGYNRWVIGGENPREAITKFRILQEYDIIEDCTASQPAISPKKIATAKFCKMELSPQTGRGHQLRLHMKAGLGCPIIGDHLHGVETDTRANAGSSNLAVALCAPRLCLHAWKIEINWNGLRLEAVSPEPF